MASGADDVYIEIVPDRHSFRGAQEVFGWGVLPVRCCVTQVEPVGDEGMALLLIDDGELLLTREQLNDANVIIKSLMVANERARRQLEYAERHTSEADHRAKTIHDEVTAWKQLW